MNDDPLWPGTPGDRPVPQAELELGGRTAPTYREQHVPDFDEKDYQSHRNVYVAVHVPYSIPKKHKHRKKHHHRSHDARPDAEPDHHHQVPKTPTDPCDRVKFILGEEEGTDAPDAPTHTTHSIFTELEELKYDHRDHKMEWKETARWVKFEEDVEEGGDKWSKPHVATLSLHSLFELRSLMLKGTFLLDLPATNLAQISDLVLDGLVSTGQLEEQNREKVRAALLQRHKHQGAKKESSLLDDALGHIRSLGEIGRTNSNTEGNGNGNGHGHGHGHGHGYGFPFSAPNLGVFKNLRRHSTQSASVGIPGNGTKKKNGNGSKTSNSHDGSAIHLEEESRQESQEDMDYERQNSHPLKVDQHFMKKIPPGSEASNVLVGEVDFLTHSIIAFVRLQKGQLLGDLTEVPIPTRFLFILLGPKGNCDRYHEIGRSIATLMSDEVFHDVAYKARNKDDLLAGVDEFLDKVTVLPPGEWDPQIRLEPPPKVPSQAERRQNVAAAGGSDDDGSKAPPVQCSKIPFKGLVTDVKRRYPHYWGDIRDAISIQALASVIFIFFANITPAITFGTVLSNMTDNSFGALEMILAVAIGNIVYSIFAGQPLVVLGGTGPTLIFEDIVFTFCTTYNIPYLNFRFWIGMWTALFMIVLVGTNFSAIMRLFTRFTEEIFSALISLIFIYEAFVAVWDIHVDYPFSEWLLFPTVKRKCNCYEFPSEESFASSVFANVSNINDTRLIGSFWDYPDINCSESLLRKYLGDRCPDPELYADNRLNDIFLMSVILFFGTFMVSFYVKKFRNSSFFSGFVRRVISDFAVFISVIVWVVVDILSRVDTPKLDVPNVFEDGLFADSRRGFIINPLGNGIPSWAPIAAIIPALLATILLFMDQQITALIVNRKDHKLKKGPGYHLDLLIVGILIFFHSLLGLPWVVGATVRSITHVQSLFIYSPCTAPGERPKFLGVREQRVTLFSMAVLMGLSIVAFQALRLLPLPVLYGIFLYIGVASLYGVQFVQRLFLPFMSDKHKPDYEFLRHIPNRRIHAYTLFQVVFLALLCVFKVVGQISIVFPIMVLLLVFGRWLAGFLFSRKDLIILDDPIPEKFYCKRFREEGKNDVEGGTGGETEGFESPLLDRNGRLSQPVEKEPNINITQELDKTELWRNMVRHLDSPIPSPRRKARYGVAASNPQVVVTDEQQGGDWEGGVRFDDEIPTSVELPPRRSIYQSTAV